ncbi:Nuclear pore complex protein NUP1 [Cucurbita argyrosperma subsp. argyrosperma]|nr:Nuclear pore complex protein NUP1 [Cucurbita argyrosperma subsp. argyrosperma]
MERAEGGTSSTPYGGGGIGGKVRKPNTRKPLPSPYARPVHNQSHRRWLSKLVDLPTGSLPAEPPDCFHICSRNHCPLMPFRLLETKIKTPENVIIDKVEAEVEDNVSGEEPQNLGVSTLVGLPGSSGEANRSENNSDFNGCQKDKENNALGGNGKIDVEKWIQGKTFSRDEVSRLLEVLRSRALEPSNKVEDNTFSPQSIEKQVEQPSTANRVLEMPREGKQEELERATGGNLTPHPHSLVSRYNVLNIKETGSSIGMKLREVGASPVDIASAYMSNQKSEPGLASDKMPDDEKALRHGDHQMFKPFIPSMSPNPSTCWPGAMSESQRGYVTPRSQRGRFGLHNFPRTPYSRSIFSMSKSKSKLTQLQGDGQKFVNTPSPLWQRSRSPAYSMMTSSKDPLDEATGSIGLTCSLQHKASAVTNSRRSAYFYPPQQPEMEIENNISEAIFPDMKKNLDRGGASTIPLSQSVGINNSESSLPTVRPQSSQVARTILEHITRNPPTPKEKTEELKRAIEWKKTPSANVPSVKPNETSSLAVDIDSHQKANQVDQNCHPQLSDEGKTMSTVLPKEGAGRNPDAANQNPYGLKFRFSNAESKHKDDAGLNIGSSSPKAVPKIFPALGSEVWTQIKPSPSLGGKPIFPSITISKPESKWAFSSDSGSAFTFPVSGASSGMLSEPPRPSIFPSTSLGGGQPLQSSFTTCEEFDVDSQRIPEKSGKREWDTYLHPSSFLRMKERSRYLNR